MTNNTDKSRKTTIHNSCKARVTRKREGRGKRWGDYKGNRLTQEPEHKIKTTQNQRKLKTKNVTNFSKTWDCDTSIHLSSSASSLQV